MMTMNALVFLLGVALLPRLAMSHMWYVGSMDQAVASPKMDATEFVPPLGEDFHWEAPDLKTQSRSPCPMLNSLANHGMIPRSGKGVTSNMIATALKTHLNVNHAFWWKVANTTILLVAPQETAIELHAIAMHTVIQHDATLTRNDMGQGQFFTRVNRTLVDQLLALNVDGYLTYDSMGRARILRQQQSAEWNPAYSLPGEHPTIDSNLFTNKKILAVDQAAIPLLILSDNDKHGTTEGHKVPVERLREFFYFERIPYSTGWVRSKDEIADVQQVFEGIGNLLKYYDKYDGQHMTSPTGLNGPPAPNTKCPSGPAGGPVREECY